jgi:hypothetical protein
MMVFDKGDVLVSNRSGKRYIIKKSNILEKMYLVQTIDLKDHIDDDQGGVWMPSTLVHSDYGLDYKMSIMIKRDMKLKELLK